MKKGDAESAIRALCHTWKAECFPATTTNDLHFSDFAKWIRDRQPDLFEFRSTMGAIANAERWFDDEFGQAWRN